MLNRPDLNRLKGLAWLVAARNEIQSLMFMLHDRWRKLDVANRQMALGASFSLWRAAFLLAEKELDRPIAGRDGQPVRRGRVDAAADAFLLQLVRTNTITFGDDLRSAPWTAGYYINNAVYRVNEMKGASGSNLGSSIRTMRTAWNAAFDDLSAFVAGTKTGTTLPDAPKSSTIERS